MAAERLFGPGNGEQMRDTAIAHGIDFDTQALATVAKMDEMQAAQQVLVDEFERNIGPETWGAVGNALALSHNTENARRGLLMLLNSNVLGGQAAPIVADLFGSLSASATAFMRATLTHLVGRMVLGFDADTVEKRIVEPFNAIMVSKVEIFDLLSDANTKFTNELLAAMKTKAEANMKGPEYTPPTLVASNDEAPVPPVEPDAAG